MEADDGFLHPFLRYRVVCPRFLDNGWSEVPELEKLGEDGRTVASGFSNAQLPREPS